jgi:hypothetical protein
MLHLLQCTRKSLIEIVLAVAGAAGVGLGVVMDELECMPPLRAARRGVVDQSSLIAANLRDAAAGQAARHPVNGMRRRRHSCPNPR